jgi:predicted Ser/Thr protein kinase/ketosteroid isomerase-like protein
VTDLAIGAEFAGCRIEQVIGRGGMGVVYRGRDLTLDRPVAIKVISAERALDHDARRRFEREARLMASIDHPNVIPVYGAGEQDGHLYLVMRYVAGTDLQTLLRQRRRLSALEAARIVDQVGRALDAAHERGLVHRDIKPANVLLSGERGDHVYLTDFGISRLVDERTRTTSSGEWIGTVDYMSPEHLRGEVTEASSDVYSLGCLLYTCLIGDPPLHRDTTAATMAAHLHERPPRPSQTASGLKRFDDVIARAMAKRPRDRYRSAGRLGTAALAAAQSGRRTRIPRYLRLAAADREPEPGEEPTRLRPPTRATVVAGEHPRREPGAGVTAVTARRGLAFARGFWGGGAKARRERQRRRTATIAAVTVVVLVVAAAIVVAVIALPGKHKTAPPGPLTGAEITAVVQQFATAYGDADGTALAAVLAPDVTRIDLTGTQKGEAAVLSEYEQQFKTKPVPIGYTLSGLAVHAGWVGRATADYSVKLKGGGSLGGHVVFGLERARGRAEIALIATEEK